jgi:phosphoribosyl 1,2-cyclic phosphodiesterase
MGRILVIDDDEIVRALVSEILGAHGHHVSTAADGEAGLTQARSEHPDVIIVDLLMPKLHGYGVVEQIRRDPELNSSRIIVSSLKTYPSDVRQAQSAGADRYLKKPYDPDTLVQVVAGVMKGDVLRVKFWGTRGSIATPGPDTTRYGGNTACVEVRYGEHILVIDSGTGIRPLGNALLQEFPRPPLHVHIFVSHTHWDHIQGFPFFTPSYAPGNEIYLYSVRGAGKPLEKIFRGQMDNDYFPVLLSDMLAHLHFVELTGPVQIGPLTVAFEYLNHPGIAIGFRISIGGKSVVYISDHEPFYRFQPQHELGELAERKVTDFARGADLYIREAQYTEEEYAAKKGWGHSTPQDALRSAAEAKVRQLAIFHHDPTHDDAFMDQMMEGCQQSVRDSNDSLTCFVAKEGDVVEI